MFTAGQIVFALFFFISFIIIIFYSYKQDKKTINKHLEMLTDQNLKNLYLNLTSSIQKNES